MTTSNSEQVFYQVKAIAVGVADIVIANNVAQPLWSAPTLVLKSLIRKRRCEELIAEQNEVPDKRCHLQSLLMLVLGKNGKGKVKVHTVHLI